MKKLLLLIATLMTLAAKSQTSVYHPFPDSNIVWIQQDWHTDFIPFPPCVIYNDNDLFISCDTTIGIYTYHKLYADGYIHATCPSPGWYYYGQYWGAFRQDVLNKRIYLAINGIDSLAYDFNLNVGDTLPMSCLQGSETNYVHSIDSVLIGSEYHKRFWLSSLIQNAPDYASLIEGIGSSLNAFPTMLPPFEAGNDLYCVKINNQTVWTNPLFPGFQCNLLSVNENLQNENSISLQPNPLHVYSVFSVNAEFIKSELKIYNEFGQTVKKYFINELQTIINRDELPDGIYFYQLSTSKGQTASGKFIIE